MSSPNSPLFYDQHLTHQHSELNQTPIYQQISTHSSDLPIVTVTSSNEGVFEGVGYGNYPEKLDVRAFMDV
jgi:hypothetical protein